MSMDRQFYEIAEQEAKRELNIATEIYLARKCTSIRYNDLMSDRDGLVTSRSLISWLDDRKRKPNIIDGLITFYIKENQSHFDNGYWQPAYLPEMMLRIKDLTTRKDVITSKQKRDEFTRSFSNDRWLFEATAITGLKMLETLYQRNALITNEAFMWIQQVLQARQLIESQAKRTGRQMKNHDYHIDNVYEEIEEHFTLMQRNLQKRLESSNTKEYEIYNKHRQRISNNISLIGELVRTETPLLVE